MKRAFHPWLGNKGMAYMMSGEQLFACGNLSPNWFATYQHPSGAPGGICERVPPSVRRRLDKIVGART